MNPNPKPARIKLSKAKLSELKRDKWLIQGRVCAGCGLPVELKYSHLCHIRSRGAGGGDTLDNVKVKHWDCHLIKEHGPRWSKGDNG